jgi:hypothetical protein
VLVIFGFFQFQSFYRQFHSIHSSSSSSSSIITYRPSLLGEAVYRIESKSNRFVRVDGSCKLQLHQKIWNSGSIRLFDLPARVRTDLFSRSFIHFALLSQQLLSLRLSLWADTFKKKSQHQKNGKGRPLEHDRRSGARRPVLFACTPGASFKSVRLLFGLRCA